MSIVRAEQSRRRAAKSSVTVSCVDGVRVRCPLAGAVGLVRCPGMDGKRQEGGRDRVGAGPVPHK